MYKRQLLDALLDDAAARGLYDGEVPALRVNFEARIMGAVMPRESETAARFEPVSYTHLDVYKRQGHHNGAKAVDKALDEQVAHGDKALL